MREAQIVVTNHALQVVFAPREQLVSCGRPA